VRQAAIAHISGFTHPSSDFHGYFKQKAANIIPKIITLCFDDTIVRTSVFVSQRVGNTP
jgi:hypothetical protein